jgi:hypothetical protein
LPYWAEPGADDERPVSRPPPAWPAVVPFLPSGPAAMGNLQPAGGGLLDVQLPWSALTGESGEPGQLGRIGPITPAQARCLASVASADPDVLWRIIITSRDGQALAVTRVPKAASGRRAGQVSNADRAKAGQGSDVGQVGGRGLVRRVTLTISEDCLGAAEPAGLPSSLAARALRAATLAAERAGWQAEADAASGGCAHEQASLAYRPPPRLREFVTARDVTCRFLTCRQPVWRCDLDHSVPFDQGGRTCSCNLGGLCRFHHQVKQHRGWELSQPVPGTFAWTTPAGRVYVVEPDRHAA